jgi:hypothetical protein
LARQADQLVLLASDQADMGIVISAVDLQAGINGPDVTAAM